MAIIGVVAVMTLPALMSNTQEQQARTALKKSITSLTQAGEMSAAKHGANFSGVANVGTLTDSIAAGNKTLSV